MFGFFKKDPIQQLEKEYNALLLKARDIQRSGDIKQFAIVSAEAEAVYQQIEKLRAEKKG